ncbi:hypothetical protein F4604DRAFT_650485 [Suillus subluteus]|nr:hypothetical protein F4604DRAFT_650485 [Suillus subluteus]
MAGNISQFYVEDDSPEIVYYPFVDTSLSPNASAGWEQFYSVSGAASSPGQVGVGYSTHFTNLNEASFMIKWNGTGIDLLGNASNASYQITLDGINIFPNTSDSESILASLHDLTNTNHTVLLTTFTNQTTPDSYIVFDKALITYTAPPGIINSTTNSTTIDDDNDIAFVGRWSYVTDSTGNSMHMSNTAGDHAQTTFIGSALTVYGLVSSFSGDYSVTIDNITTSFSALSSYNNSNALLYFATELSQDTSHTVVLTNTQNTTFAMRVGGMNVTAFGNDTTTSSTILSSSSSSIYAGTIAAIVLGAILVILIACILIYWLFVVRPRARRRQKLSQSYSRKMMDPGRVIDISPPCEEETEVESLSTSKGYGFGLGLQRTFPFVRKTKNGGGSSSHVDNTRSRSASHVAIPPEERGDDKRLSANTLTVEFTALGFPPESEKLAPGWTNPIARTSFGSMGKGHTRAGSHRLALPELYVEEVGVEDAYDDDDADAKTLTSRQDETLAATLSLSPRTSEAPGVFVSAVRSIAGIESAVTENGSRDPASSVLSRPGSRFLEVRETSPFRVDVGAILGQLRGRQDSRRTSGSGSSSWSRVYARLYRRAHRDDGKQSIHEDKSQNPSPESVPVVMLQSGSGSEPPPSEDAPASGTYSFLDFTSSHSSLRRQSKTTTLSSAAAELGHSGVRTPWSDSSTSIRMVRIERDKPGDAMHSGPDAPSTVSQGSQNESPSDKSNAHSSPSAHATHTTHGSSFPFPITIPPSSHMPHPFNIDYQRESEPEEPQSFSPPSPPSPSVPRQAQAPSEPRHSGLLSDADSPASPTESVPFSVSDVYFRHSYSDYTDIDSRRESAASTLPPHPPLPSSQPNTPPPYIVQRVLGMSPVTPNSPATRLAAGPASHSSAGRVFRPGTSPLGSSPRGPYRMGSLIGPRPRPSTSGSPNLRLPLQGSWSATINDRLPSSQR